MGMLKGYLLRIQERCSEHQFGQDAIEWAIVSGLVPLTYQFDTDANAIAARYDEIIQAYRAARQIAEPLLEQTINALGEAGLPITELSTGDIDQAA